VKECAAWSMCFGRLLAEMSVTSGSSSSNSSTTGHGLLSLHVSAHPAAAAVSTAAIGVNVFCLQHQYAGLKSGWDEALGQNACCNILAKCKCKLANCQHQQRRQAATLDTSKPCCSLG
jgi:hypothetical protein